MPKRGNPNMKKGLPSINPSGRAGAKVTPAGIFDGWISELTGLGTSQDKRTHTTYGTTDGEIVDHATARHMWRTDWVAAKLIEKHAVDMTRKGFSVSVQLADGESAKDIQSLLYEEWRRLDLMGVLRKAKQYARAYGGGPVLIGATSQQTADRPLGKVRGVEFLTPMLPHTLTPKTYYSDPLAPHYNDVEVWTINPEVEHGAANSVDVHSSRLLVFDGISVSDRREDGCLPGWGDSVLTRVWAVIRAFQSAYAGAELAMSEAGHGTWKIDGLAQLLASGNEGALRDRLKAADMAKSRVRSIIIGTGDEYTRDGGVPAGTEGILKQFDQQLAAAADMPLSEFMGVSPGGLGSSGGHETSSYDDAVAGMQMEEMVPHIERISALILQAKGVTYESLKVVPNPLRQPTESEIADLRLKVAQTDKILIESGIITPEEAAESHYGGDDYSTEITIDFDNRSLIQIEPEPEPEPDAE